MNRVIPILLLKGSGIYKTVNFRNPVYVGDPINAVRIFNDKEVDELIFLDITASVDDKLPNIEILNDITSECFMPLAFGGGITTLDMIREILNVGVEKVAINTAAVKNPQLISDASRFFGRSTIIASIDAKRDFFGNYRVYINGGNEKTSLDPVAWAQKLEILGVGEILINSIDNDGLMNGYDYELIKRISSKVSVPVIAAGGAGNISHFVRAIKESKASAVAAGSFFVFKGKHKAVLITYPDKTNLEKEFN
jgi:cyclase